MSDNQTTSENDRIVVDCENAAELEIESLDVGVASDVLAFDVSGNIKTVSASRLQDLSGSDLKLAELTFVVTDAS
ncbi:hypothetical protein [Halobacterium zhouii]|uniref:hypothetical protein n=1 Tax=Halobacterium zhouii TaxID=2902624 RepID=UPI001E371FA8|nr:hypothetical protein [Halobacterium zhouii]